jgi:hypothetical protein
VNASQVLHAIPGTSFDTGTQKTTVMIYRASTEVIDAFKKQDPKFCQFLLETGRLVAVGGQKNGIIVLYQTPNLKMEGSYVCR